MYRTVIVTSVSASIRITFIAFGAPYRIGSLNTFLTDWSMFNAILLNLHADGVVLS
jgi:hypothetical protein